jgi:threonine dehydratase
MIVEPSSAIALAVVLNNPEVFRRQGLGLMMTGGNVEVAALPFSSFEQ